MEMSNDYMPEMHVAQQRRRDKLRVQQLEDLHHNNFHHNNHSNNTTLHNNNSTSMVFPTEMLNFSVSQSIPFASIHPSRFVAPSNSDSCDPQPLQISCDNWVSSYDDHGRRNSIVSHFSSHNNSNSNMNSTATAEVLAAHYYHNNDVHNWENNGGNNNNELALLPSFVSPANENASALSLSLSSNQIREMHHLSEQRELKPFELGSVPMVVKLDSGKHEIQDVVGSSSRHVLRNVGPLGPFTGYATILRGSKFLKPAQVLLEEFFTVAGLRHVRGCEEVESLPSSNALGSSFRGSNDLSCGSASGESYRPDCNEKKAKLLHMQEEVWKRQKQYHQQMEMVISAFESVPGLSNATPYISRSLKSISRQFRSLKNAISEQLKLIMRALGEDLSTPTSYMKGDNSRSRFDHNFIKMKANAVGGSGYGGQQNHIWRPQRGLPERAVSILRAWLFDHFLHPYPTDTDKQMLASQTGLSRNQVSNWFINARVRLWKPMVEEIHTLETKATGRSEPNPNHRQAASSHQPAVNAICVDKPLDCLGSSSYMEGSQGESNTVQLFQKTSRIENQQMSTNMDNSFIGFYPHQRLGLELGGLGPVSLTLGLRHGSETSHQQQMQHPYLHQGMHFGGHVMHDFTG